jgi:hypothetical protein
VFLWFVGGAFLPAYVSGLVRDQSVFSQGNPPSWWTAYEVWNPVPTDATHLFLEQFLHRLHPILSNLALSDQAVQQQVHVLEGQMPDLAAFAGAHIVLVGVGLILVAAAASTFRRFRGQIV